MTKEISNFLFYWGRKSKPTQMIEDKHILILKFLGPLMYILVKFTFLSHVQLLTRLALTTTQAGQ